MCLSLWKVDDTATSLLMQRFYRERFEQGGEPGKGMSMAEALKRS